MDIKQVLQARTNRRTRLGRPFSNFFETAQQCIDAGSLILSGSVDPNVKTLLERSAVISLVTAIEVYYRDILNFIFEYCKPTFFEPHLKQLFPEKFDIVDLMEVYRHQVHPLELVSAIQSFQNVDRIDRVFSKFLDGDGLWGSVLQLKVRIKSDLASESSFTRDELIALKRVFDLRHELVHDPARSSFFSPQILDDLWAATYFVSGSDIILTNVIQTNLISTSSTNTAP